MKRSDSDFAAFRAFRRHLMRVGIPALLALVGCRPSRVEDRVVPSALSPVHTASVSHAAPTVPQLVQPADSTVDAGGDLPPDVVQVLEKASSGMGDCISIAPLGQWRTFYLDVSFTLAAEGLIQDARLEHADTYCSEGVIVRRLKALRFSSQ